jgi:hypothetical protein
MRTALAAQRTARALEVLDQRRHGATSSRGSSPAAATRVSGRGERASATISATVWCSSASGASGILNSPEPAWCVFGSLI